MVYHLFSHHLSMQLAPQLGECEVLMMRIPEGSGVGWYLAWMYTLLDCLEVQW